MQTERDISDMSCETGKANLLTPVSTLLFILCSDIPYFYLVLYPSLWATLSAQPFSLEKTYFSRAADRQTCSGEKKIKGLVGGGVILLVN